MLKALLKSVLKLIAFITVVAVVFFVFCRADWIQSEDYQKLRLEVKSSGNGYVIRMKPQGWEVWKLEKKIETGKVYPQAAANAV